MKKGALFRFLPAAIVAALVIALAVTFWHPYKIFAPKVVVANEHGEVASQSLPGDFYNAVQAARSAEGDACAYAKDARGAAENAEGDAKLADKAADSAFGGEQGYAVLRGADGTYAGQVDPDRLPDGHGVKTFTAPNGTTAGTYRGQWTHGKQDHLGVLQTKSTVYKGHFEDGTKSGNGVFRFDGEPYTSPNGQTHYPGETYEGQWSHGSVDGYAVLFGGTGAVFYEMFGQFNDQVNSFGVLRRKDGTQLLGSVKHGKSNGACVEIDAQDVPVEAGYCVDGELQTTRWPQSSSDKAPPFPRDQRCRDFEVASPNASGARPPQQ